jgi:hypothetical protein
MGRVGSCFDCAAAAEAFVFSMEWEVLSRHTMTDPDHARAVVVPWCYDFYIHRRRHSSANMLSPIDYENLTADQPVAAQEKPSTIRRKPTSTALLALLAGAVSNGALAHYRKRPRTTNSHAAASRENGYEYPIHMGR